MTARLGGLSTMKNIKIIIPYGLEFSSLKLKITPSEELEYDLAPLEAVARESGLAADYFATQPEREAAAVIAQWYLHHRAAGGVQDAAAEQMLRKAMQSEEPQPKSAHMPAALTGAEFRTFCQALGLSAKALASLARVQERSVRHWWSDASPPAGVVELVQRLDATMQDETMQALERVHAETEEHGQAPDLVQLWAYRSEDDLWQAMPNFRGWMPIQAHSVMLWRTAQALRNIGVAVEISYDKP